MSETKIIQVDYLARVEGEGALTIKMVDGVAEDVRLRIFEPPRFFEGFLRGRQFAEAPDLTARICGICPVAYQMSACHAMEDAIGLSVPRPLERLRRLLYCGEWIESHALHMFMLHAPDFLGCDDVVAMSRAHPEWVQKGLAIKKVGNALVSAVGGREIHPINVKVGGFYRVPTRPRLEALVPALDQALGFAEESARWMATFDFPDFERDYELVSLKHPGEYPFCEGRLVSNRGLDIDVRSYPDHFEERHVEHSTALHSALRGRGAYLCGPLARVNLCFDELGEVARRTARDVGFEPPVLNPFKSLLARGIELVQALDEARRAIAGFEAPEVDAVEAHPRAGVGHGCTEAPRGILYHRYRLDEAGAIEEATIIPPTSQNQRTIEDDLRAMAPTLAALEHDQATWRAEQAVRNYDPCISCSTHFLKLRIERARTSEG